MSDLDTLARVPVFSGLSEPQLRAVLEVVRPQRVPQGTVIIQEGKSGDSLFILTRGSVEVTKRLGLASVTLASEKEKTIVRLDAPQFFGEMGLLENAERSATVTALGGCDLLEIIRLDFERLAQADPLFGYLVVRNIAAILSSRLRRTDQDLVKLTMALSLALGNR